MHRQHAVQRLQRLQRAVEPALHGVRGRVGLALEGAAQALLIPAIHRQRGRHQQQRHPDQRRRHRAAPRCPEAARLADQRQHGRRGNQHAERIADPPGPPGEGQRLGGHRPGPPQCERGQRRVGQAGQGCGQQQKAPDVARQGQGQRLTDMTTHQPQAEPGLQCGTQADHRRYAQRRQVELPARGAEPVVDGEGTDGRARERRAAVDPRRGEGDACRRVQRRGVTRSEGQTQGQPAGQCVGQCAQQHHPGPGRRFGSIAHRGLVVVIAPTGRHGKSEPSTGVEDARGRLRAFCGLVAPALSGTTNPAAAARGCRSGWRRRPCPLPSPTT